MSMDLIVYLQQLETIDIADLTQYVSVNFEFEIGFPEGFDINDQSGFLPISLSNLHTAPGQVAISLETGIELDITKRDEEELTDYLPDRPFLLLFSLQSGPYPYSEDLSAYAMAAYLIERCGGVLSDPQESEEFDITRIEAVKGYVEQFKAEIGNSFESKMSDYSATTARFPPKNRTRTRYLLYVTPCLIILAVIAIFSLAGENGKRSDESLPVPTASVSDVSNQTMIDIEGIQEDAYRSLKSSRYLLVVGSKATYNYGLCRLVALDGSFDKSLQLENMDETFEATIAEDRYYTFEISLDDTLRRATLTVSKMNYIIDFDGGSYKTEIIYRKQDFRSEDLLDSSPDQKLFLYRTYLDSGGEAIWGDYVVHNRRTDEIHYAAPYSGHHSSAIFIGNDAILIDRGDELEYLNALTGAPIANGIPFDYGSNAGQNQFTTVGIGYDADLKIILVAYRESKEIESDTWPAATHPVYIAVYNTDGDETARFDTDYIMTPYYIVGNKIDFNVVSPGQAELSTSLDGKLGTIQYADAG